MKYIKTLIMICCALPMLAGCAGGLAAFNKGQRLEQQGKLDEAVMKYAEASAAYPDNAEYRVRFLTASAEAAKVHFKKGEDYQALKKYDDALREYQTAFALDPSFERSGQMIDQVMKLRNALKYLKEGEEYEKNRKLREALASYKKALEFDSTNVEARQAVDRLLKSRKTKLDGFELNLKSTKPITLKFKDAKIKEVFNILTQLSGINFVFDDGIKDQNVSIMLENATFQQALEILTGINKLGKKVLNESTIILYPKNPEKSKQYEELRVETFQLNKLDAKKAVNLIRTMLPAKKIYVNEEMNALVIRDTPEAIEIVRKILDANDIPDAELVLDVEVVEIAKSNADNFGLVLSKYAVTSAVVTPSGSYLTDTFSTTPPTTANPANLLNIFSWNNFTGFITVPNATFNFAKTLSNGQTLANPKIRVKNREKSKFNVGTRQPITTTSSPVGGGVSVNVQYIDVGVKVNAEPTVQLNDEINIKLSLEVSTVINRQTVGPPESFTTVVTIGTRNLDTVLTLKDGETSIIGGLITDNKTDSKQTISVLGDIPLIGPFLTGTNKTNDKTELVLAITPHIVRGITAPDADVASFWSGKEDEPSTVIPYASFVQEPDFTQVQPAAQASPAMPAAPAMPLSPAMPTASVPPGAPPAAPPLPSDPANLSDMAGPASPAAPNPPAGSAAAAGMTEAGAPQSAAVPSPLPGTLLNMTAPPAASLNGQFSVAITVANATNLFSAPFVLTYDPAILDFVGASEGPFLKSDGKPTTFQAATTKNSGQVTVNLSRIGNVGGVNGAGALVSLMFRAKNQGAANLGFSTVHFTDPGGKPLDVIPFSAVVNVQ